MSDAAGDPSLVDRHPELAAVRHAVGATARGVGSAICIVGPAGIGKTRLAREAVSIAGAAGFHCVWGSGWSGGGAPPLWPWQSVVAQLGHPEASLPSDEHQSEQERFATFRVVADTLASAARVQPILVVLDDAHTTDAGALLLARFVLRSLTAAPVLVVVTAREPKEAPSSVRAALEDLCGHGALIRPRPLSEAAVGRWLRATGHRPVRAQVAEVHGLTGGNPLVMGELLASGAPMSPTATDARTVLLLRTRTLSAAAEHVLSIIAVLGELARSPLVAAAAGLDEDDTAGLVREAESTGIIHRDPRDVIVFTHRMLADAVLSSRSSTQLAELHELVAEVLERPNVAPTDQVLAAAHHRLAASALLRDVDSLVAAVQSCRRASASLSAGFAYEAAAHLVARAVELHDEIGVAAPPSLVLDVALAELSAGNLRAARTWFRRAADNTGDSVELATAAIGLGGIWVHEHRSAAERAAYLALVQRSLAGLGDDRPDLAARLHVRLAAERVYTRDGSPAAVDAAVARARMLGSPLVLAEALSLQHHTRLGPANTAPPRLALADEVVRQAAAAGDAVLGLMGVLWRAVDLVLAGDPRADRGLVEARERADALQVAAVLFVLDAIDVMRLLRRGDLIEGERAAHQCLRAGVEIGDADAMGYFGGHLLTIGWLRLEPHELLPLARQAAVSASKVESDVSQLAAAAVFGAMVGDHETASADLHHVIAAVPHSVEISSNWMITMFCAAEAALLLGDRDVAKEVHAALLPFRQLPILGSLGVMCLGSAERSLGVAALGFGDVDLAVHHFERAVAGNQQIGNRVMATIAEGELGCSLIERALDDDLARGRAHVERTIDRLSAFGLTARANQLRARADELLAKAKVPDGRIIRSSSGWQLEYGEHTVTLLPSVGLERLCHLLANPRVDLPAATLAGELAYEVHQELNDVAALRAYRRRIDEIRSDLEQADHDHDLALAATLRDELDIVLAHLRTTMGMGGMSRSFSDSGERARVAVRKSLVRIFDTIEHQDAEFARCLRASIHTGASCRFDPVQRFPSVWRSTPTG